MNNLCNLLHKIYIRFPQLVVYNQLQQPQSGMIRHMRIFFLTTLLLASTIISPVFTHAQTEADLLEADIEELIEMFATPDFAASGTPILTTEEDLAGTSTLSAEEAAAQNKDFIEQLQKANADELARLRGELGVSTENTYNQNTEEIQSLLESTIREGFSSNLNPDFAISFNPKFPQPGERVIASINDYSTKYYGASINWTINGEIVPEALNSRKVEFVANFDGEPQTISAILTLNTGETETLQETISPDYLDIIVEPQTHVPDFYQGRSLPSYGSQVNATALLDGYNNRTNSLVYTWRINREVIDGGPLRGGNKVSFNMPRGSFSTLSVEVADINGQIISSRSTLIPAVSPELSFYEDNPLFGISKKTLNGDYTFLGNSLTIQAVPYYLDIKTYNNPGVSEWNLNRSRSVIQTEEPYKITLQRSAASGTSNLNFHVRSLDQLLQGVEASIDLKF